VVLGAAPSFAARLKEASALFIFLIGFAPRNMLKI